MKRSGRVSTVGKYQLRSMIGRGGMGTVYRAFDPTLDRDVAIKMLAMPLVANPAFVAAFLSEARKAASLQHPNIVTIYDVGTAGKRPFLVMELVKGLSLEALLKKDGRLTARRTAHIVSDVTSALSYAHEHGLIHRDVKPGNILITTNGTAKLTDFGVARAVEEANQGPVSLNVGTPTYMAPEQFDGNVTSSADTYSLAVVAYHMLTGRPPFQQRNPYAVAVAHKDEPPPAMRDIPQRVEKVVAKALAKRPAARYQTPRAFADALDAAVESRKRTSIGLATIAIILRQNTTALLAAVATLFAIAAVTFGTHSLSQVDQLRRTQTALAAQVNATAPPVPLSAGDLTPTPNPAATSTTQALQRAQTEVAISIATLEAPTQQVSATTRESTPVSKILPETRAPTINIINPSAGAPVDGHVVMSWAYQAQPRPAQLRYQPEVCYGENCTPDRAVTTTTELEYRWCPDRGKGTYTWHVRAGEGGAGPILATSRNRTFVWSGRPRGAEKGCPRPQPKTGPGRSEPTQSPPPVLP